MADFVITDNYTLRTPSVGMGDPCVVEQAGAFFALRLNIGGSTEPGPIPHDWLGPYATLAEATDHLVDLPPPPPAPPLLPPFIPPLPEPEPTG